MKRIALIVIIVLLSAIVAIGGEVTLTNSSRVQKEESVVMKVYSNYSIYIDVTTNKLSLKRDGKCIKTYPISAGKPLTPSPIGNWHITDKAKWNSGFGGYWLGFRVPWGRFGIHGTLEPWGIGKAVSHGCIRMYNKDVAELYKMIPVGTAVKIYGGPYGAFGEGLRTIKSGQFGADVFELEKILKARGYFKGNIDGIFGRSLLMAVHEFQHKNHMKYRDRIDNEFYDKLGVKLMK